MDELISRKAAIDELVKMLGYCFQADEEVIDAVVTTLKELPPAELSTNLAEVGKDVPDINVGELISRQAALEKVADYIYNVYRFLGLGGITKSGCMEAAESVIGEGELPPILPRTGKWEKIVDGIEYTWGTCDSCGARIPMPYKYYEFCPHCGMKNEVKHG